MTVGKHYVFAMALSAVSMGCSGGNDEAMGEAPESVGSVDATLVYKLELSPNHRIEFYEHGLGITTALEAIHMDEGPGLFKGLEEKSRTLAEIYRIVRPDGEIPLEITAADERSQEKLAVLSKASEQELDALLADGATPLENAERLGQVEQAAVVCSSDWFGDNWGAQWFIDNFVGPDYSRPCGGFTNFDHDTNIGSVTLNKNSKYGITWTDFEGDFNNNGWHSTTLRRPGNVPQRILWNEAVPPRWVFTRVGGATGNQGLIYTAHGSSQCNHLGFNLSYCTLIQ